MLKTKKTDTIDTVVDKVKASASDQVDYMRENDDFAAPEIHYNE